MRWRENHKNQGGVRNVKKNVAQLLFGTKESIKWKSKSDQRWKNGVVFQLTDAACCLVSSLADVNPEIMMLMWISLVHPNKISGLDGWWCNERLRTAATSFNCGLFGAVARCRKGRVAGKFLFWPWESETPNTSPSAVVQCPPLTESFWLPKVSFLWSPTFEINYVQKVCCVSFLQEIHKS